MPVVSESFCDRCGEGPLKEGRWADGYLSVGSMEDMRDVLGRDDFDREVVLCAACYVEFKRGMKAWFQGATITVKRAVDNVDA